MGWPAIPKEKGNRRAPLLGARSGTAPLPLSHPQQQRDGPDRSESAKREPQGDPPNLGAGRQPGELILQEVEFVQDSREVRLR